MDNQNILPASGSASELSQQIGELRTRAARQLEALQQAQITARDCRPFYGEMEDAFTQRQARVQAELAHQEQRSEDLLRELGQPRAALIRRLEGGQESLGLTPEQWQQAGTLSGLATSLVEQGSLGEALAALRSAVSAHDAPRMAAFLAAAERRLRQPAPENGKVSLGDKQDERELRQVMSEIRMALRDRTLDPVRERFRELGGVVGDLSGMLTNVRGKRQLEAELASGQRVPWPKEGEVQRVYSPHMRPHIGWRSGPGAWEARPGAGKD